MTTAPTIEQSLAKARQAYVELRERVVALEARHREWEASRRLARSTLNRDWSELMHCPSRIDRLVGRVEVLMADLEERQKREAQA